MRPSYSKLVDNQAISAVTFNSSGLPLAQMYGYSIQALWTGTLAGTIKLQATIDGSTWSDIGSTSQALGGAAGSFLWNVTGAFYNQVRVALTGVTGTGNLTVWQQAKGP